MDIGQTEQTQAEQTQAEIFERELKENSEIAEQMFAKGKELLKQQSIETEYKTDDYNNSTNAIYTLKSEYDHLLTEKDSTIRKIIAQMYKGTLIEGRVSCRNGGVFRFRRSGEVNVGYLKKLVYMYAHEVKEKIKSEYMDLLDYLLSTIDEEDDDYYYSNRRNNDDEREDILTIPINKQFVVASTGWRRRNAEGELQELKFVYIKEASITNNGAVTFLDNDDTAVSVDSYISERFIKINEEKIKNHCQKKITEYQAKIKSLKQEVEEIKEKGGNLLTTAMLMEEARSNK